MTITTEQYQLNTAARRIGRAFGVGGTSWAVVRSSGDGISEPAVTISIGTISGYVLPRSGRSFVQDSAPPPIRTADHVLILLSGSIAVGDWLISAADATFVLRVESVFEGMPNGYLLLQQTDAPALSDAPIFIFDFLNAGSDLPPAL